MALASIWRWYTRAIMVRPMLTQSISAGTVMALGDATVQCVSLVRLQPLTDQRSVLSKVDYVYQRFDLSRTVRYFLLSSLIIGPGLRCWFVFLSRRFERQTAVSGVSGAGRLKMLIADQVLIPPIMWLTFLGYTSIVVRGDRTAVEVRQFVMNRLPSMAVNSYRVWPLAQTINFFLVPLHFRLLYVSCVGYFWNCYICWHSNRD